ncbi:hypothetical protein ACA910_014448 [Epithemia clementina (nom. ined.)]
MSVLRLILQLCLALSTSTPIHSFIIVLPPPKVSASWREQCCPEGWARKLPGRPPKNSQTRFFLLAAAYNADDNNPSFLFEDDDDDDDEISDEELLAASGEWDDRIAPFNTVHLTGRVGNDPQAKYFDDGKVVVNLSLAVKRKYHAMEWNARNMSPGEEETDWFGLEIWGQTAEFVAKYVDKGARVGVIGSLEIDDWNDRQTGELRLRAKVIVRDFDILETRAESETRRARNSGSSSSGRGSSSSWSSSSPRSGGGGGKFGRYNDDDNDSDSFFNS